MAKAGDLRPGATVMYKGQFHEILEAQHYKPGKGGAIIRMKFRNLYSGSISPDTLRPDDTLEEVYVEQKEMQYLYKDNMGYCCMDEDTFEQIHIPEEKIGSARDYLKENMIIIAKICDGEIITVVPPIHVVLKIVETEPGFRGDTVTGATKPAKLETGKVIKVPLFIENGQMVKVDTRTGEYIERA